MGQDSAGVGDRLPFPRLFLQEVWTYLRRSLDGPLCPLPARPPGRPLAPDPESPARPSCWAPAGEGTVGAKHRVRAHRRRWDQCSEL